MDGHLVFHRTEKGEKEFKERVCKLPQRLRTVLILIDGNKDVKTLHEYAEGVIPDIDARLEELAMEGFIECEGLHWHKVDDAAAGDESDNDIESIRSKLIDTAIMVLGKQSDVLVKKLDAADATLESLNDAVAHCCKISSLIIDKEQCDELRTKFKRILSNTDVNAVHEGDKGASGTETQAGDAPVGEIRERLLEMMYEVLGEKAGKVSERIEKADDSIEALNEALEKSLKSIQLFIDEKKAEDLSRRCHEVLKVS